MSTEQPSALSDQPSAPSPMAGGDQPGVSAPETESSYDFFGNSRLLVSAATP